MTLVYIVLAFLAIIVACLGQATPPQTPPSSELDTFQVAPVPFSSSRAHTPRARQDPFDNVDLLDIVLVASVDGKFHALNRTSGENLWSMSTSDHHSVPSALSPLIRTEHPEVDPDLFDNGSHETYIIEPQTGDIYVSTSNSSPLQRFPYSMSQLVDHSPLTYLLGDNQRRMYVGRKETSLLLVELETGKIKATIDPQCPWDPFEDLHDDIDLDDLESDDSRRPQMTEVFIGRTDYKISIFERREGSSKSIPIQNLSFSSYGPNNQDLQLQASYTRTKDASYIQTLPNGEVVALNASTSTDHPHAESKPYLWTTVFPNPIVAVFDVFTKPTLTESSKAPFVLLQPRPRLEEVYSQFSSLSLPNAGDAFVGIVPESGSLYALSPSQYPLVAFGERDPPRLLHGVEELTRLRKQREEKERLRQLCSTPDGAMMDRRCLTGIKPVYTESSHEAIPTLLPPPSSVPLIDAAPSENASTLPSGGEHDPPLGSWNSLQNILFPLLLALASFGYLLRLRSTRSKRAGQPAAQAPQYVSETPSVDIPTSLLPATSTPETLQPVETSSSGSYAPPEVPPTQETNLEEEPDVAPQASPAKKKVRRGKRGGGGKKKAALADLNEDGALNGDGQATPTPRSNITFDSPPTPAAKGPSLVVSDNILGFGSHGTVVFKGSLQGRAVAVKRLLQDFVTLASREVSILQESDYHPNVIRYYYQEAHANFLYIALELCPCSLADIIENPDRDEWRDIAISFEPKKALQQITAGLRHLHGLKLVHRDIKPQNILISAVKSIRDKATYRMLISDFGLCKKLDVDQTSFVPTAHGAMAAGTVGWRAPEILRGEVKLDDVDENSLSSRGSVGSASGSGSVSSSIKPTRLTKSIDIFALGCLFYYTMTNGGHPFGDRFEREINILKNAKSLDGLERFGEEGSEASDLIQSMLAPESAARPDTATCLLHPFFWDSSRRLNFLQDASDRFEIMCRDPKDLNLVALETEAFEVVGSDWQSRLDKTFLENLGKFRKYDGASVQDLLRALRNKKNHYQDLPDHVKRNLGPLPDGFLAYFTRRYPQLFLHVHSVVRNTSLRTDPLFRSYFHLSD